MNVFDMLYEIGQGLKALFRSGIHGMNGSGVDGPVAQGQSRMVWFHREYKTLSGGQLKHSHYFDHVLRMPGFAPKITFSGELLNESHEARSRRQLWPAGENGAAARWEPGRRDVLFLSGMDWRYLIGSGLEALANPRINLVQGIRHAHEGTEFYHYLAQKAVRICVSQEVADAISATGRANGPVLTIPNGTDCRSGQSSPAAYEARARSITIAGYKRPELARALSRRLDEEHIDHLLVTQFLNRSTFLDLLAGSRIAVRLPRVEEGFYLVALEAMALGCLVVTLDCIANSGFCHHDGNCFIAEHNPESLFRATKRALDLPRPGMRTGLLRRARDTAAEHSLEAERARFHAILGDIDRLWRTG